MRITYEIGPSGPQHTIYGVSLNETFQFLKKAYPSKEIAVWVQSKGK